MIRNLSSICAACSRKWDRRGEPAVAQPQRHETAQHARRVLFKDARPYRRSEKEAMERAALLL